MHSKNAANRSAAMTVEVTSKPADTSSQNPKRPTSLIHSPLAQFDELPDSAYVRLPVVIGLLACSKSTLWRWVKNSRIASPHKLGSRITAWNVGQLRQSLDALRSHVNVRNNHYKDAGLHD